MSVVNPAYKKCCFEQKKPPVTGEKSFIYTKASLKFTLFGTKTKKIAALRTSRELRSSF